MNRSSPLGVIFLTVFIDLVGFGIIIPLQPFYVEAAGGSGLHVGALFASYSFGQFLFVPIWGRLSDRIGRRPVILMTLVGTGVSFAVFAAAGDLLWLLFVARTAAGIFAGSMATAQAYIADVTTKEDRARGMGIIGAAFGLGFVVGPALGGALAILGPAWPPALAAGLAFGNAIFAAFVLRESRDPEVAQRTVFRWFDPQGLRAARRNRTLALSFAILFLATVAFANLETTFSLLMAHNLGLGRTGTSWLFVYLGVFAAVVQGGLLGRLTRRFGSAALVVVGTGSLCISMAILPELTTLPLVLGACAFVAVGSSLNRPSINTIVSLESGTDAQGALLGTASSVSSLGRVVGPAVGGVLWDVAPQLPYQFGAGVMLVAFVLALGLRRQASSAPCTTSRANGSGGQPG